MNLESKEWTFLTKNKAMEISMSFYMQVKMLQTQIRVTLNSKSKESRNLLLNKFQRCKKALRISYFLGSKCSAWRNNRNSNS